MTPTKEELVKLKVSELEIALQERDLDSTGKKSELVERLWRALELEKITDSKIDDDKGAELRSETSDFQATCPEDKARKLLRRLRLLKEQEFLDSQR